MSGRVARTQSDIKFGKECDRERDMAEEVIKDKMRLDKEMRNSLA